MERMYQEKLLVAPLFDMLCDIGYLQQNDSVFKKGLLVHKKGIGVFK